MILSLYIGHVPHAKGILREVKVLRTTSIPNPVNVVFLNRLNFQTIMTPKVRLCQLGGNPYPNLVRANLQRQVAAKAHTPGHRDHDPSGTLIRHLAPAVTTFYETPLSVETRLLRLLENRRR
jgi:hypothetical protein